jgi:hypothetical protein
VNDSADAWGSLNVTVETPSYFLGNNLPFVVRDARQSVVGRGRSGMSINLPPALYSVSVVSPDGHESSQVMKVEPGLTARAIFYTPGTDLSLDVEPPTLDNAVQTTTLRSSTGCEVHRSGPGWWEMTPDPQPDAAPSAAFGIGNRFCSMSLPLNPRGAYPLDACIVAVREPGQLQMSFAEQRRVARMVDGLARTGQLLAAQDILREAGQLLLEKYSDPPAAALGGLTLHRLGSLGEHQDWVENLARDFSWIPDGLVLLAALLVKGSRNDRARGLDLLLEATTRRPLYTDALSLAMELLRRWPDDAAAAQRRQNLEALADYSAYADWGAVNLTLYSDEPVDS